MVSYADWFGKPAVRMHVATHVDGRRKRCRPRRTPNLGYNLFSNVRVENGSVVYYHPADQPPPPDAPTQCATDLIPVHTECVAWKRSRPLDVVCSPTWAGAETKPPMQACTARRYTFWSFTAHDVQVPIVYRAVLAGEASPLDMYGPT